MTKNIAIKLRRIFEMQARYEKLRDIGEHAHVGQEILVKTSRTNSLTSQDVQLASLIREYAEGKLKDLDLEIKGIME